mgnify:CR=1 FL=1
MKTRNSNKKEGIKKRIKYIRWFGFLGLLGFTGFIKSPEGSFRYLNFVFFGFFSFFVAPVLSEDSDEREIYNNEKARNIARKFIWGCFLIALLFLRKNAWTNYSIKYLDTKILELILIYIFAGYYLVYAFSFHYFDRIK